MSTWIKFVLTHEYDKTNKWEVLRKDEQLSLGVIKWFGAFHKYVFLPIGGIVFGSRDLQDIANFIKEQMVKHHYANIPKKVILNKENIPQL